MADEEEESRSKQPSGPWTPTPDPTVLTTENLRREIKGLRELLEEKINGEARLLRAEIAANARLSEQQFELVERQRVEQKADTKTAVDAALSAQKEAVKEQTSASERAIAKSESGTSNQLQQLGDNFKTANNGLVTSLDDLKERVGRVENRGLGVLENQQESRANNSQVTSIIVAVFAGLAFVVSLGGFIAYVATHH